jgi:putative isomerase
MFAMVLALLGSPWPSTAGVAVAEVAAPVTFVSLANRTTGLFIDGFGRASNGAAAGQASRSDSHAQHWVIEQSGSYVLIRNRSTGLYLDGMGRTAGGSVCGQWAASGSWNQQWTQEAVGAYTKFKNRATGLYLDGAGLSPSGSNLKQYGSSGSNNQQWLLTTVAAGVGGYEAAYERFRQDFENLTGEQGLGGLAARVQEVNHDIVESGIVRSSETGTELLSGYDYGQFYDWDMYFEGIYQSYQREHEFDLSNLDGFFYKQQPDGWIPRSFGPMPWGADHPYKPFIAQTSLLGFKQGGNVDWLRNNFDRINKYLRSWYSRYDKDGNGLVTWVNADASGMDNQNSRVIGTNNTEGVDANVFLYREHLALSEIATLLGRSSDASALVTKANSIKAAINSLLWDPTDGIYYDRRLDTGQRSKVKGVSAFTPLWAGIASTAQAQRLVLEHLTDPTEFWDAYGITSLSKDSAAYDQSGAQAPDFWCNWNGPTWMSQNYMIFHGLLDYGYDAVAKELATKTLNLVYKRNPTLREYYNATTGEGYGRNPFWGWSSLGYFMLLEYHLEYDPTAISTISDPILPLAAPLGVSMFGDSNPALSSIVTTSSSQANAGKLVDGFATPASSWSSNGTLPQTVTLTFAAPRSVAALSLQAHPAAAPERVKAEARVNGQWVQVADTPVAWTAGQVVQQRFLLTTNVGAASAVRLTISDSSAGGGGLTLGEIGVLDKAPRVKVSAAGGGLPQISQYQGTRQFVVTTGYSDPLATPQVTWSLISGTEYATVDASGTVRARGSANGTAVLQAKLPGGQAFTRDVKISGQVENLVFNPARTGTPSVSATYSTTGHSPWGLVDGGHEIANKSQVWANWVKPYRPQDTVTFTLGQTRTVDTAHLWFYKDAADVGAAQAVDIQYWSGTAWVSAPNQVKPAAFLPTDYAGATKNVVTFSPVTTTQLRVVLTAKANTAVTMTEIEFFA